MAVRNVIFEVFAAYALLLSFVAGSSFLVRFKFDVWPLHSTSSLKPPFEAIPGSSRLYLAYILALIVVAISISIPLHVRRGLEQPLSELANVCGHPRRALIKVRLL